jgi:hypothetical protein
MDDMPRALISILILFSLASCGPPLVWGGDEATKDRLLEIIPLGTTVDALEAEAKARDWRMFIGDDRSFPKGERHYFGGGCEYQGGVSRNYTVAEYGLFTTSVEALWLFDEHDRLGALCVRSTTDAL